MQNIQIGDAAEKYGLEKRVFQKRLTTALFSPKRRDLFNLHFQEGVPPTGLSDVYSPEMKSFYEDFIARPGTKPGPETKAAGPGFSPDAATIGLPGKEKRTDTKNPPVQKTRPEIIIEGPKLDVQKLSDRVFAAEGLLLFGLAILIFSDGFSMAILAGRIISVNAGYCFGLVGTVIGYAAVRNAWALSRVEKKRWESDRVVEWAVVFSVFQAALHGAAFVLFADWSEFVGKILICVATPLGTASLIFTMLKR